MGYLLLLLPFLLWLFVCAAGLAPLIMLRFADFSPVEPAIPIFQKALSALTLEEQERKGIIDLESLRDQVRTTR